MWHNSKNGGNSGGSIPDILWMGRAFDCNFTISGNCKCLVRLLGDVIAGYNRRLVLYRNEEILYNVSGTKFDYTGVFDLQAGDNIRVSVSETAYMDIIQVCIAKLD